MKILQKICFVLLMIMFLSSCSSVRSVYRGDCFKDKDIDDCRVKAEQGNPRAQLLLGALYLKGKGFFISSKEAVKWVRKSAEQGYARAQYLLGVMYFDGRGVSKDYKEALWWLRKAAIQGIVDSQLKVGVIYYNGQGVLQDYVMAHMYWNIAAVGGSKDAIKNRDVIEKEMTPSQIEEAQDLARVWMRNHQ